VSQAGARPINAGGQGDRVIVVGMGLILALLILPVAITLVRNSLVVGERLGRTGTFSFGAYEEILGSAFLPSLILNTLVFALGSTLVGVALGGALAWCVERTDAPFKRLVYAGVFVSFAVPGILRTIGWIFLLGPRTGALNELARVFAGADAMLLDVFSLPAMILIEGIFWVPLAFLMLASTLGSMDPSLEEAAATASARPLTIVRRVTLPLALPSLIAVFLLAFIRSIQAFEVPLLLGVPARVQVFTTEVYLSVQGRLVPDYSFASAYGVLLLVFLVGCILLYGRATRNASRFATITGKGYRPRVAPLGRARPLAGAFILVVAGLQFLPVLYLVFASFLPTFGLSGPPWEHLTLGNYSTVLANPDIFASLRNSALVGGVTATAVVAIAALTAWAMTRTKVRGRGLLDQLASLPLVFPGIVLGIAVLGLYARSPVPIYGTIWILVLAYITGYLPYGLRYVHPGLLRIHPELEESGRASGANWGAVVRRIVLPLLRPSLVAGWIFVFLISVRELSVAALLWTPRSPVIATTMLDLWSNGNVNQVSAFGAIVALLSMAAAALVAGVSRRWGIRV
jgi:iron(III) transport system permease protein